MGTDLKNEKIILTDDELETIRKFLFNEASYNNKTYSLSQNKVSGLLQIEESSYVEISDTECDALVKSIKFDIGIFQKEKKRIGCDYLLTITLSEDVSWKVIKNYIPRATRPPVQVDPQGATEYTLRRLPKELYPERTTSNSSEFFLCSNLKEDDNFHIPQTSTESNRLLDSLNAGNYELLQDYFRCGIHPGPLISDLYFRQHKNKKKLYC